LSQITDTVVNFAGTNGDGNCVLITDVDVSQMLRGRMGMENLFWGDGLGWIQFVH